MYLSPIECDFFLPWTLRALSHSIKFPAWDSPPKINRGLPRMESSYNCRNFAWQLVLHKHRFALECALLCISNSIHWIGIAVLRCRQYKSNNRLHKLRSEIQGPDYLVMNFILTEYVDMHTVTHTHVHTLACRGCIRQWLCLGEVGLPDYQRKHWGCRNFVTA